ncbi:unnamed protein product [Protopolystoma xenopodis]|uniref:Uncharacterized protein n=1 Tax=Protopolystoma xenopodis TaxID=117903 RepID=A0A3S5C941_9PLAT|nr:unnamed protein product [Protopolystoma xenopodis]
MDTLNEDHFQGDEFGGDRMDDYNERDMGGGLNDADNESLRGGNDENIV